MRWQAYLTHDRVATLTSQEIKDDKATFSKWIKDLDNPTDKEVADYFRNHFADMSDEWEIPVNGTFRIDKDVDEALPEGTIQGADSDEIERKWENCLVLCLDSDTYVLESAAPIRMRKLAEGEKVKVTKPLSSDEIDAPYGDKDDYE